MACFIQIRIVGPYNRQSIRLKNTHGSFARVGIGRNVNTVREHSHHINDRLYNAADKRVSYKQRLSADKYEQ